MKWKWVLGILAGLVIALAATVYIILLTYDFSALKPEIQKAAKAFTGRDLTLKGDIKIEIGLTPALAVDDVTFQNAPWGSRPDMARIKRFEVQVALLPLIRGDIEVKRLVLVEPDILIETNPSGRSNLSFQVPQKKKVSEKAAPAGIALPVLAVGDVRLEKARLTYRDGRSGRSYAVALDSLTARGRGPDDPVDIGIKGQYNGRPFEVEGTLGSLRALADPARPWPLDMSARAGGAALSVKGTIRDALNAKGLSLDLKAEGRSIMEAAELAELKDIPKAGPFKVSLRISDPKGRLRVEKLDVQAGAEELALVSLKGAIRDPLALKGIDIRFQVRGRDLANMEKLAGKPIPLKGPFSVSGRAVDVGPRTFRVSDLKVAMDENRAEGRVEIGLAGKRPRLTASLSSDGLDLRPLFPKVEKTRRPSQKSSGPEPGPEKIFPKDPLPVELLKKADANVSLRLGKVILPQLALADLKADLSLQNGHLRIEPLKGSAGGGTLDGALEVISEGTRVHVAADIFIKELDIGRMLREMESKELIEGKMDAEIQLEGSGESVAAIMAGLNGKTSLVMGKGRLANKYADLLGGDLASTAFRLLNPLKKDVPYTDFNCLVKGFRIKDGMANVTALVLDTDKMTMVGDGTINLATEHMSMVIRPAPKKGLNTGVLGKVGLSLGELTRPIRLEGPLSRPRPTVDTTQALLTAGKVVGGTVLFGPAGILAAMASKAKKGDENPCLKAIEAARKGVRVSREEKPRKKGTAEKATDGLEETVKGLGDGLKRLFGK
jgi:AsmA family protein